MVNEGAIKEKIPVLLTGICVFNERFMQFVQQPVAKSQMYFLP